ncbi:MAG: Gfo/Idh/MocA family oxidoreductase [Planctomycetota bacterium]|nr:Gfo/Idh/MocA family oxidoreductase [Planctomycetota bacterium]
MRHREPSSAAKSSSRRNFLAASATVATGAALSQLAIQSRAYAAGTDVIKVGIVGCGGRCTGAAVNAMNVDPGAKLVAMCDLFMDRVQGKREMLKKQKPDQVDVPDDRCFAGFDGYKKVIACADVVLIANAAKFHPLHARAALDAGKHVFVEKPHGIDPKGIKDLIAACDFAKEKKLSIVSGLQSRFEPAYQETMKRIHDGAIGDIVTIEENFLRAPYVLSKRQPGMTELQYQCSTQYHFTWLSGDDVPQSLVHNVDRSLWAMRDQPPVKCHALAGRSSMTDPLYGNVFDHHSVIYEFANGVKLYAFCRTTDNCYNEVSSLIYGTKGRCNLLAGRIDGETKWSYAGPKANPYDVEVKALLDSVRKGEPINSGYHMARSTLATIMGQLSCYTGKEMKWDAVAASDFCYPPKPEECSFDMEPPVKPGPDGKYPTYVPGFTKLL